MQRALGANIASSFEPMREVREKSASAFVKIEGNAHAAGISVIRSIVELRTHHAIATRRDRSKPDRADSESRILATKKFSCCGRRRLIALAKTSFLSESPILIRTPACAARTSF